MSSPEDPQVARLSALVESLSSRVEEHHETVTRRLDRVSALLSSPHPDRPGIVVRVDRIEQTLKRARWIAGVVATAAGSLASWLWSLLHHR